MNRFESRRDKLRSRIRKAQADALLVTNFTHVTYLTGFSGDDSYLLVAPDDVILFSDGRYTTQLEEECPDLDLVIRKQGVTMVQAVSKALKRYPLRRLGIEAHSMTVGLREALDGELRAKELVSTQDLVEGLRVIKDRGEVQSIRRAAQQARRAFEVICASWTPDQTERQVAADIEHQLRRFGAVGCSFPPIVATGARAALPHANVTEALLGAADFTLVDWGAREGLYVSDLTRMVVTGKISPKFQRIYGVVLKAQRAAIRAIRPGTTCEKVDKVARSIIAQAGLGKAFSHGLGHGIGLEVHEAPRLAKGEETILKPGMVVTVEPGVYLPGWGGIRIEDDVLVTRGGHDVLTAVPKELEQSVVA